MTGAALVITCEHAGRTVPRPYQALFASRRARTALVTHRGYDPGALGVARRMSRMLDVPLLACMTTRLLVEINRSPGHPRLFSEFSDALDRSAREQVLRRHYEPHRRGVEAAIERHLQRGRPVTHLGIHTFTETLNGTARRADIGLLYDPARPGERRICRLWQASLREAHAYVVRRNYPYRGSDDGLTTFLRRRFAPGHYAGIEIEINQRVVANDVSAQRRVARALSTTLDRVLRREC